MSYINSALSPIYVYKIHFNIILPYKPVFSYWFFSSGFQINNLYAHLLSSVYATCPTQLVLLDFIRR